MHLAARGARRVAVEDPCNPEQRQIVARAGLEPVPVPVDGDGILVDRLGDADAVVVTPAHQHPTVRCSAPSGVAGRARRAGDRGRLRRRVPLRRAAAGALQGLAGDRVVYAGSTSKTLAPALPLAWLVLPPALTEKVDAPRMVAERDRRARPQPLLASRS